MTISETIALCMLALAIISLLAGIFRSGKREAASQQTISDQIKSVVDGLAEVRTVLTGLRDDFASHGQQLAAMQARMDGIETRLSRVEDRCESHAGMGGTD